MGSSSGSQRQRNASTGSDARDNSPIGTSTNCPKQIAKLAVVVRRCDKAEKIGGISVHAEKPPKLTASSAEGSGIADFGVVDPGSYTITTVLTPAQRKKFLPATPVSVSVPKGMAVRQPVCLPPVVRLRVMLADVNPADGTDRKISGAKWELQDATDTKTGTTGGDGKIDVEIPWTLTKVELKVTLPDAPDDFVSTAPADPPAPAANAVPPYPIKLRPSQFPKPKPEAQRMPLQLVFSVMVSDIEDGEGTNGALARLRNLGYRFEPGKERRAVVAYQFRYMGEDWGGSGVVGDIEGDLKGRHDA